MRFCFFLFSTFFLQAQEPHYAPATHPRSPYRPAGVEARTIPRLLPASGAKRADWEKRRKELLRDWSQILGRLEPGPESRQWVGDPRQARTGKCEQLPRYERCEISIPIEKDFSQTYLLLRPLSPGKHPAVIAWTSTTPDYRKPEEWWGKWLAEQGFVVLCGWPFLRNYREGSSFREGAPEKVHERFGRWMGVSKMAWDAGQEVKYLQSRKDVDGRRIGFIGFSLGAKGALYAAAFTPGLAAIVAVDPHVPLNGSTNWFARWYLDWMHPYPDIPTPEKTVFSLLNSNPSTPEFEHDHHELLALAAPRPLLILGGNSTGQPVVDSDGVETAGYIERARDVYRVYGAEDRLQFVLSGEGHKAVGPKTDAAWQAFFLRWLSGGPK